VVVLIASSLLNALYYFPIVINAFFAGGKQAGAAKLIRDEVPVGMLWTTALMAVLCVGFAFWRPNWPVVIITSLVANIF
jgi:NADH:ubiquinone oxidoreductase subunit 2 (subunit N)